MLEVFCSSLEVQSTSEVRLHCSGSPQVGYLQAWRFHGLPGQKCQCLTTTTLSRCILISKQSIPCTSTACYPLRVLLFVPTGWVVAGGHEALLNLLLTKQTSSISLSSYTARFRPWPSRWPLLHSLFHVLRSLEEDAALQALSHRAREEESLPFTSWLCSSWQSPARGQPCCCSWWVCAPQDPHVLLCKSVSEPADSHPVWLHRVILSEVQDLASLSNAMGWYSP